jgi:WD40 repeat protein
MNHHLWLVCWGMLLVAAGAGAQEIEGSRPLPDSDVPAADPIKPAEPPAEASPLTRAIRGVMGLKQTAPKVAVTPQMKAAIDEALHDLASDDYHTRESAALRLIEIGYPALASLQEAAKSPDPEVRFRAGQLFAIVQSRVLFDSRALAGHEDIVWTVAYSHSGRLLASGGGGQHNNGQWSPGNDFAIRIWDPTTEKVIRTIKGHSSTINRLVWSSSDNYLLSASSDGTARIWRTKDSSEFRIFRGHEGPVSHALFTPDEKQVITSSWDQTIRIWDVKSGKELRKIRWPEGRVWGIDLSPDGTLLAVCGDNPVIRLYNFHDGKPARELKGHGGNVVTVDFSPDGTQLASGAWDNSARIWDVKGFKFAQDLPGHASRVEGLTWSDDGKFLVTGCLDSKVRVYDAAKGVLVRAYEGHAQGVSKVAVSPLGDAIASAGWDSEIRIWPTTGIAEGIALGLPPLVSPPRGITPAAPPVMAPGPVPFPVRPLPFRMEMEMRRVFDR